MRLGNAMQTQMRRSLHIGKTHDQHLEACCCHAVYFISIIACWYAYCLAYTIIYI